MIAKRPLRVLVLGASGFIGRHLVFGEGGASASLFTTLAALPLIPVPGDGGQRVQPIHIDDLTQAIVRLLESEAWSGQRIAAVGPQSLTVRAFLQVLRDAMGLGRTATLQVPMIVVRAAASLGNRFPRALLDTETLGMLLRGNTASSAHIVSLLGRTPRAPKFFIDPAAAQTVATRAKLAWLLPILRISVAALPSQYWRYHRIWTALGVPAFVAFIAIFYLMVVKPA